MKYLPYIAGLAAALVMLVAFRHPPLRTLLWADAAIIGKSGNSFAVAIGMEAGCMVVAGVLVYLTVNKILESGVRHGD